MIQKYAAAVEKINPKPLKRLNYLMIFQIVLNIIYFLTFYMSISQYITDYQKPNELGLINHGKRISNLGLATLANVEMEYYYHNMTDEVDQNQYIYFLKKIVNFNSKTIKEKNYFDRNLGSSLDYQKYYKEILTFEVDYQSFKVKEKRFIDIFDEILDTFSNNLAIMKENFDYSSINYDYFITLQRNYIHYCNTSISVYSFMKNTYLSSNTDTSDQITQLFIILLCLYISTKIIELYFWNSYFDLLNAMIIIFMRINEKEINSSIQLSQYFLTVLNDPYEKFFRINITTKIYEKMIEKEVRQESKEIKKNHVKSKKPDRNSFKIKFTKKMAFLFLCYFILGCCSFFFYFLNFYNWKLNNDTIKQIIQLDMFFIDLYTYTTTVISCNNLLIREKVIRNPSYEKADHIYQTNPERIKFFSGILEKRIDYISNITAFNLINIGLQAKEKTKNPDLEEILGGNLCDFLVKKKDIDAGSFEYNFCEKILNGGFRKGIATAENEFIQKIKLQRLTITKDYDSADALNEQKEQIIQYLKDPMHMELLIGEFYLNQILLYLFDVISNYYGDILQGEIDVMNTFLTASFILINLFCIMIIWINYSYNRKNFKHISFIFYLIPIERINDDEQTVYLLKKFLNKNTQKDF